MFTKETLAFLGDLKANNTRDWFTENKARYTLHVKDAAKVFCDDLASRLAARYGTDVTAKMFRIHRDLRFSKDKTPFNAHVHIGFGDAATGAAWMFGLHPDELKIGYGLFAFDKQRLALWRDVVAGSAGDKLTDLLEDARQNGLRIPEPELKRVPSPYPADHPNATLLRHKGLAVWQDAFHLDHALGHDAGTRIADALRAFDPLRNWMVEHLPA
ncbi:TIGR02453 family protein [Aliiroseovarius sediminilitoris]|uniref:TIGR02453 family protein n=1 Tax=Aliiroseovarius sediminilitoris TaxID=1173584 RepID=A0A1I0QQH7_9RHOB|nr:TIGR02453 family protein [Aliiroseovarius sediminilitoris]SEW29766.1 TIGR02453 family protein [Aliiroseovarius sediminilitoris]